MRPVIGRALNAWQFDEYVRDRPCAPPILTEQTDFTGLGKNCRNHPRANLLGTTIASPGSLRSCPTDDHRLVFRVLFYSPRIAPNTGNAIRMVAATGCELHLVEPLGFDLSEPKLRRAGLDYHDLASVRVHKSLADAWRMLSPARVFAFTAHANKSFADVEYQRGDVLMFGPEPTGLDSATLADPHITARVRIPMLAGRRSLNLSNAAAVAVYEAWRQQGFLGGT
jgi:tRNA (cytidine/uridine-2'-O-)-methyltransferase